MVNRVLRLSSVRNRVINAVIPTVSIVVGTVSLAHAQEAPQAPPSPAAPAPVPKMLTGDWGGTRTDLANKGYTLDASLTQFYMDPVSGDFKTKADGYGKLDIFLDADGTKGGWGKGIGVHTHGELRYGGSGIAVGTTLNPTIVNSQYPTTSGAKFAFTSFNVTAMLSKKWRAQIGKNNMYDVGKNTPFRGGRGVDAFWNGAFSGPVINARVVPAINIGGIFNFIDAISPTQPAVYTFGVFDPNACNTTTGLDHAFSSGVTLMAGLLLPGTAPDKGTHSINIFYSSKDRASLKDLANVVIPPLPPAEKTRRSWTLSYDYSQPLAKKWGWFGSLATSNGDPNVSRISATLGIGGSGIITSRPQDKFGLGTFYLNPDRSFQDALRPLFPTQDEYGMETFYDFAVTDWLKVGPDLQVVQSVRKNANTLVVIGVRGQLRF